MVTIGVTGGVGAGKSRVLDYLASAWQAELLRLDDVGRELMRPGTEVFDAIVALFGISIKKADGQLNRRRIAELIFDDESLRLKLDAIVHPAVKREALRRMAEAEAAGARLFVIEAALLIEDHYDAICSELWYIYASETTRYRRLREERGYDDARIRGTMARQLPDGEFRKHTDFTVDNSGDFALTQAQVDGRVQILLKGSKT